MSNDIILSIKNELAGLQTGLDEDTKAVAGGGGGNNRRISIKGGVFRKFAGGKEVGAIEDRHMNVIFTKLAHTASRTYYSQSYKEGEKVSPVCWSSDSKVPDAEVRSPPAATCDSCQYSIKGSGQGGTSAACRLSWRTAVVLPNHPEGDVMQLVLPATSCFGKEDNGKYPFRPYIQMLANNNISAGRVITRMQFDTKSPVPKLLFSPIGAVPTADVEKVLAQSKSAVSEAAIKLTVFQQDEGDNGMFPPPAAQNAEPKLRESKPEGDGDPSDDMSDLVKKWANKKK